MNVITKGTLSTHSDKGVVDVFSELARWAHFLRTATDVSASCSRSEICSGSYWSFVVHCVSIGCAERIGGLVQE